MKRSRAILVCLLILAALSCVYGAKKYPMLNSTDDAKKLIDEHSVSLLHLLANNIYYFNNSNNGSLDFDPTKDYGSHYYRNQENLLDPPPPGCSYYTMGNFKKKNKCNTCSNSKKVPPYVCNPKGLNTPNENRARILLCINHNGYEWRIHKAYLTQHYKLNMSNPRNTSYDPGCTFEISPELLRELKEFSFNDDVAELQRLRDRYNQNIDNTQLNDIINTWGRKKAPLGLLIQLLNLSRRRMKRDYDIPIGECQICELQQIYVDVVTGNNGYATVVWRNVPQHYVRDGAVLLLINNQKNGKTETTIKLTSTEGRYATWVSLDEELQVRLHNYESGWFSSAVKDEICRGKEFQSPDAVPIKSYNFAKLQLFVRDGYSCFRLYIDDCDEWKSRFYYSWVGLYGSDRDDTDNYRQWQWVTKFTQGPDSGEYKTFEYCTGTAVAPGLQARFMIEDYDVKASTPEWPQSVGSSPEDPHTELLVQLI